MSKPTIVEFDASQVRAWYRADEKRLARLSDAARHTVEPGARGKLHPEVGIDFAKRARGKVFADGLASKRRREAQFSAAEKRQQLRAQGVPVASRGRLPKVELSQSKD